MHCFANYSHRNLQITKALYKFELNVKFLFKIMPQMIKCVHFNQHFESKIKYKYITNYSWKN